MLPKIRGNKTRVPAEPGTLAGDNPLSGLGEESQLSEICFNIDAFFGAFAHQELVPRLAGGQGRRVRRISLGACLLYFLPLLMCLASALLLEVAAARDLPALGTAGTALFLACHAAATVNFLLMLLHPGRCRRR